MSSARNDSVLEFPSYYFASLLYTSMYSVVFWSASYTTMLGSKWAFTEISQSIVNIAKNARHSFVKCLYVIPLMYILRLNPYSSYTTTWFRFDILGAPFGIDGKTYIGYTVGTTTPLLLRLYRLFGEYQEQKTFLPLATFPMILHSFALIFILLWENAENMFTSTSGYKWNQTY